VIHRTLVIVAFICCALVFSSFALFARDQLAGASEQQQQALAAGPADAAATAPPVHHEPGQPRKFIDSAAKTLTSPFTSIVPSSSEWVEKGLPTLFALLVYGVGLGYLARYTQGLA
jgi:hypothetical protein